MDLKQCPNCDRALEHGYLLGKHIQIRWSISKKGMTIFHGVPLIKKQANFWRSKQWLFYAPSIPAAKCSTCMLVTFTYDNDEPENLNNEAWPSLLIGILLIIMALVLIAVVFWGDLLHPPLPLSLGLILLIISLFLLSIGGVFGLHGFRSLRAKK